MVIFPFCCDILNLNLVFVKGAIWQHCVTERLFLLTDHAHSRLGKFLYVSLVRDTPAAWWKQLPGGKMVSPHQSVQSYVKWHCVIVFKEFASKGFGERHEKLPDRTAWVIFSVPQQWFQLSGVLMLCPLVVGVRPDTDYQVNFGGTDPVGHSNPSLWYLGSEGLLFAQCPSLTPVFRPQC